MNSEWSAATLDALGLPPGYPFRLDLEITPRQARDLLTSRRLVLLDVRTPAEWAICRVNGSLHAPLDALGSHVDDLEGRADVIAAICHHGVRSIKAALMLRGAGIAKAVSVAGGIDLWSIAVDASVPRYHRDAFGCRLA